MTTIIAKTVTRAVVPIILVVSIAFFLQGHNLPGGGFIAGVMTAVGFGLIYIVYSIDYLEDHVLRQTDKAGLGQFQHSILEDYRLFTGIGLTVAVGTGLTALMFDLPFLSHDYWILKHLPVYGEFEVASAFFFDLGVYIVVTASLLTILSVVGEE